jgi:hypothetical protein
MSGDRRSELNARRERLEQKIAQYGNHAEQSIRAREALIVELLLDGEAMGALDECQKLRDQWAELAPPRGPRALRERQLRVWSLRLLNRMPEAEDEQRELVDEYTLAFGRSSARTLASRFNLLELRRRQGQVSEEGLQEYSVLVEDCVAGLGSDHTLSRSISAKYAEVRPE